MFVIDCIVQIPSLLGVTFPSKRHNQLNVKRHELTKRGFGGGCIGSELTVKSLLGKLGGLLAQEYTLIRGVAGDRQYITDELRTMQSFLRDLGNASEQCHQMKDWMKQIRDMTYDVKDCVDDSGHRIRNPRWLHSDMCCYLLVSGSYEVATREAAPRRRRQDRRP
ncbi:hypothetical protein U9M48_030264 [Paspalum notatum var. saurae]|uniref:Disease resistance N-terminal domain-containing protein n=1 Tax=Paspalum notatum var. saurae TaxID=547442 RepID=A0AAQ3TZS8_PASNO